MKLGVGLALFLAVCASAHAQSTQDQQQINVEVLTGPLRETQEQVQRYIALYDGGQQATAGAANTQKLDAPACEIASVAYLRGRQTGTGHGHDMAFQIVRILVVGVNTPNGIRPVKPAPYFTVFGVRELAA
jgi:hypothetical protein